MNGCSLKRSASREKEVRKQDLCSSCWKRPLCPLRAKGDFHIAQCSHYIKNGPVKQ